MTGTKSNKNNTSKEENETAPVTASSSPMEAVYVSLLSPVASAIYIICFLNLLYRACVEAYNIRLYAINEYGRVIHEFDPYFNYRAAEVRKKKEWNKIKSSVKISKFQYSKSHHDFCCLFTLYLVISLFFLCIYTYDCMWSSFAMLFNENLISSLLSSVSVGEWFSEILQVVRLHVMVSFGTTGWNYYLSWNAVYQCLD